MKTSALPSLLSACAAAGTSVVAYYISDIALLVFGSAVPRTERLVMLGLLAMQIACVGVLAWCIRRRHCARLRTGTDCASS